MTYVWWRLRVAYWLRRKSDMSLSEAWQHSHDMREFFTDEYGPCNPRDAVDIEISYWEY